MRSTVVLAQAMPPPIHTLANFKPGDWIGAHRGITGPDGKPLGEPYSSFAGLLDTQDTPGAVEITAAPVAAPDVCDGTSAGGESRHRIPGATVAPSLRSPDASPAAVLGVVKEAKVA